MVINAKNLNHKALNEELRGLSGDITNITNMRPNFIIKMNDSCCLTLNHGLTNYNTTIITTIILPAPPPRQ